MNTWAFTLCYNEATLIPYWIRHYQTFCDKVIIYVDTDSTDSTEHIAQSMGADVRPYQGTGYLDDIAFIDFAQEKYKEARGKANWVIWADADEIVYHPRIVERLREMWLQGISIAKTCGYSMFSDTPPHGSGQIYDEIKHGIESPAYSKVCVFDPWVDLTWITGKHDASIHGPYSGIDEGLDPLKLLHYRWLGEQWHLARNARNYRRLNEENIQRQHGRELYPGATGPYSVGWYKEQSKLATDCI